MKERHKILLVDFTKCTGCEACVLACSLEKEKSFSRAKSRIWIAKIEKEWLNMPILCEHCENPPCQAVCPVNAITKDSSTGIVKINYNKCIGCKECMWVCPFGAISYDPDRHQVFKCDLCGGEPACVKVCVPRALQFVPADKPIALAKLKTIKDRMKALKTLAVEAGV